MFSYYKLNMNETSAKFKNYPSQTKVIFNYFGKQIQPHLNKKTARMHINTPHIFSLPGQPKMSKDTFSKEEQILQVMRKVLTDIAKDTYTPADLKHPLSENTIHSIRDCLALISSREAEISKEAGRESTMHPRYVDEPSSSVVVQLDPDNFKPNKD